MASEIGLRRFSSMIIQRIALWKCSPSNHYSDTNQQDKRCEFSEFIKSNPNNKLICNIAIRFLSQVKEMQKQKQQQQIVLKDFSKWFFDADFSSFYFHTSLQRDMIEQLTMIYWNNQHIYMWLCIQHRHKKTIPIARYFFQNCFYFFRSRHIFFVRSF